VDDSATTALATLLGAATGGLTSVLATWLMHRTQARAQWLEQDALRRQNLYKPTKRSRLAFARYKGEAENALLAAGFPRVLIFRPAYIYPVEPRKEPNFGYRLLRAVYPAFRLLFPNQVIRADDLARAMVDFAIRRTDEPGNLVLENRDIRAMVRSLHWD
jgi:hypothetical protein